jgi:DNA-binding response OmpR family regulator
MRVLIIDDNKDINEMVRLCLESQDISCKVIVEGKAGLEAIKKEQNKLEWIILIRLEQLEPRINVIAGLLSRRV